MEIDKNVNDSKLNIKLSGRLDTTTAPKLENELEFDNINEVELDFKELEYVSSAGLRLILLIQKKMNSINGSLKIKNVEPEIQEVFDMTGFSDILNIEKI